MNESNYILLVDDSEDDLMLTAEALRSAGFKNAVQMVRNGEQAIAFLEGKGDYARFAAPAFILLDLKMPKKGGFEVLAWRQGQPLLGRVPIIVLTASMRIEDVKQAHELGANSFLVKPVALEDLINMLRCLREWLQFNHFPPLNEIVRRAHGDLL